MIGIKISVANLATNKIIINPRTKKASLPHHVNKKNVIRREDAMTNILRLPSDYISIIKNIKIKAGISPMQAKKNSKTPPESSLSSKKGNNIPKPENINMLKIIIPHILIVTPKFSS